MGRMKELLPDFFDPELSYRRGDPETSEAAALRGPARRQIDRSRCLIALFDHSNGLTDFELGDIVGRQQTSAGKRRGELRDRGYVEDSGLRRPAPSGSSAIVWRITALGNSIAMKLMGR